MLKSGANILQVIEDGDPKAAIKVEAKRLKKRAASEVVSRLEGHQKKKRKVQKEKKKKVKNKKVQKDIFD